MRVGLVGFAGSGKSTLFELVTGAASDPGKVHTGQAAGMATLTDPRLDLLTNLHQPKKVTRAQVEFLDTPGLFPGTQADNAQRLAVIRNAEAMLIVLNAHSGDPAQELADFREEMVYADLSVVTNRVERLEGSVKKHRPGWEEQKKELETCIAVRDILEEGGRVADLNLTEEQKKPMRSFGLLTDKAQIVVANTIIDQGAPESLVSQVPELLVIDAKLELDLAQLDEAERAGFMEDYGVTELAKDRIIRASYTAAGILTFFTAGEPEVRGWNLEIGSNAVEAAGKIHTDIARGFIRAEVMAFDDLKEAGSLKEAKARNIQRLEGKDYIVQDGDIIYFRSNA